MKNFKTIGLHGPREEMTGRYIPRGEFMWWEEGEVRYYVQRCNEPFAYKLQTIFYLTKWNSNQMKVTIFEFMNTNIQQFI